MVYIADEPNISFFNYSSNFIVISEYTFIFLYKNYRALTYISYFLNLSITLFAKFKKISLEKIGFLLLLFPFLPQVQMF